MTVTYTLSQLDRLIEGARQLGFADDVAHWTAERDKLVRTQGTASPR